MPSHAVRLEPYIECAPMRDDATFAESNSCPTYQPAVSHSSRDTVAAQVKQINESIRTNLVRAFSSLPQLPSATATSPRRRVSDTLFDVDAC